MVGEDPGTVDLETRKLKRQAIGRSKDETAPANEPLGTSIQREVTYMSEQMAQAVKSISSKMGSNHRKLYTSYLPVQENRRNRDWSNPDSSR